VYNRKKAENGGVKMSTKLFTKEEVDILSKNNYVKNVSVKGITYKDEFKRIFIAENEKGKLPREIFESCGFDINVLGIERVSSSGKRWRAAYRKNGICGLQDARKENSGRPSEKELSIEEKYERLKAQNNLLKAENELLKKIDILERRLLAKK
jgi:transposase